VKCPECGAKHGANDNYPARCPDCVEAESETARCSDCGQYGETAGHMGCQYPQDHE